MAAVDREPGADYPSTPLEAGIPGQAAPVTIPAQSIADRAFNQKASEPSQGGPMLKNVLCVSILAAVAILPAQVRAQGTAPNLAGTYRCTPEPIQCNAPSYVVTQNGNVLELKAENGPIAEAKVTSNRTLSAGPPFNSNGLILPDSSIQWSNGTHWRK